MSKHMLLLGASVLTLAGGAAALAQTTTQIYGGGGTLIAPTLRGLADCYGQNTDLLLKNGSSSPTVQTIPDFNYTGVPAYNCATSTINTGVQINYDGTGSGDGRRAIFSHSSTYIGDIDAATAGVQNWPSVHFATADAALDSAAVGRYNGGGTQDGVVVKAQGVAPGAGEFANPREKYGPLVQYPLLVAPVAIAFDPVYKKVRNVDGSITEYKINIKKHKTVADPISGAVDVGGLQLSQAAYCGIFNGTITDLNNATLKAANGAVDLKDPSDPTPISSWSVPLQIVGRSDGSGTTSIFYRNMAAVCGGVYLAAGSDAVPASLQGVTYDKTTANAPVVGELAGKFTRAAGNDGIAKYLDFTRTPGATAGDSVTQARFGYLGPDYALPASLHTGSNAYGLFTAMLANNAGKYILPNAAGALKAFGTILPPQSNASGAYDAAATTSGLRSNPQDWVQSIASSSPLASPASAASAAYPMVGTTNFLGYQCYASSATVAALSKATGTPLGFLAWYNKDKIATDAKLGLLGLSGFSPLPTAWKTAIKDTFHADKYSLGLAIAADGAAGTCSEAAIVGG